MFKTVTTNRQKNYSIPMYYKDKLNLLIFLPLDFFNTNIFFRMIVYLKFVRRFFCYLFCISWIIRYYDEPSTIYYINVRINNIPVWHNPKQNFFFYSLQFQRHVHNSISVPTKNRLHMFLCTWSLYVTSNYNSTMYMSNGPVNCRSRSVIHYLYCACYSAARPFTRTIDVYSSIIFLIISSIMRFKWPNFSVLFQ